MTVTLINFHNPSLIALSYLLLINSKFQFKFCPSFSEFYIYLKQNFFDETMVPKYVHYVPPLELRQIILANSCIVSLRERKAMID